MSKDKQLTFFQRKLNDDKKSFKLDPTLKKQYVLKIWSTSEDVSLSLCLPSSLKGWLDSVIKKLPLPFLEPSIN
jgi:hypothetical protein